VLVGRLVMDLHPLLPLGARPNAVRELLGPPERRTSKAWFYLAARYHPPASFGATCKGYFVVHFDRGKVSQLTMGPPRCPIGVNP